MTEIILVYPKTEFDYGASISPPHSLLRAAAIAYQKGYSIKIIDCRVEDNWQKGLRDSISSETLFVGISSMTGSQILYSMEIIDSIKDTGVKIVWGGVHASIQPDEILKEGYGDVIVRGEGELKVERLANALKNNLPLESVDGIIFLNNNEIVRTKEPPYLDFDKLPVTPWDLVDVEKYVHKGVLIKDSKRELDIGETSRGCPYGCTFCYNTNINKRIWRPMTPENAVRMIKYCVNKFNLDAIWLRDDNFFADLDRVQKITEILIKENLGIKWHASGLRIDTFLRISDDLMKNLIKSGCESFRFGVESGSNDILRLICKGITREQVIEANKKTIKYNLDPDFSFIIGFPTETKEDVNLTLDLVNDIERTNPAARSTLNLLVPYPGTLIFPLAVKHGVRVPNTLQGWGRWSWVDLKPPWLNKKQMKIYRKMVYTSYLVYANTLVPKPMKPFYSIFKKILNYRKQYKFYNFSPELFLARTLSLMIRK